LIGARVETTWGTRRLSAMGRGESTDVQPRLVRRRPVVDDVLVPPVLVHMLRTLLVPMPVL
jgi:hypothetical protein